ncbi:MAG: ATP-binding protein [Bacteroidetes bacterium]|jgi:DNA replication protein DnaC|nr:ATP-binding protein [Bacteroidota bacterium]
MSEIPRSLKATLKRLRLSGILHTLDDRLSYARKDSLSMLEFLELVLQDEIERRDQKGLALRLAKAGFDLDQTLESFDLDGPVSLDRQRVRDLFGLGFVAGREDVILLGPVGIGKTHVSIADTGNRRSPEAAHRSMVDGSGRGMQRGKSMGG